MLDVIGPGAIRWPSRQGVNLSPTLRGFAENPQLESRSALGRAERNRSPYHMVSRDAIGTSYNSREALQAFGVNWKAMVDGLGVDELGHGCETGCTVQ